MRISQNYLKSLYTVKTFSIGSYIKKSLSKKSPMKKFAESKESAVKSLSSRIGKISPQQKKNITYLDDENIISLREQVFDGLIDYNEISTKDLRKLLLHLKYYIKYQISHENFKTAKNAENHTTLLREELRKRQNIPTKPDKNPGFSIQEGYIFFFFFSNI